MAKKRRTVQAETIQATEDSTIGPVETAKDTREAEATQQGQPQAQMKEPAPQSQPQAVEVQEEPKDRSGDVSVIGGTTVKMIDDGNRGGLGIKFQYEDPEERPSDAVKAIVKEHHGRERGLKFIREMLQWRKPVRYDAPGESRDDVSDRYQRIVEQIKEEKKEQGRGQ